MLVSSSSLSVTAMVRKICEQTNRIRLIIIPFQVWTDTSCHRWSRRTYRRTCRSSYGKRRTADTHQRVCAMLWQGHSSRQIRRSSTLSSTRTSADRRWSPSSFTKINSTPRMLATRVQSWQSSARLRLCIRRIHYRSTTNQVWSENDRESSKQVDE